MNKRSGFTLIELLTVMAIMAILLGMSAIGFVGMRRGAELRGAVMSVRTTLVLARQQAVTKRKNVSVSFETNGPQHRMSITMGVGTNTMVYLPLGIEFTKLPSQNPLVFTPSGSASGAGKDSLTVKEKRGVAEDAALQSRDVEIWLLTGLAEGI